MYVFIDDTFLLSVPFLSLVTLFLRSPVTTSTSSTPCSLLWLVLDLLVAFLIAMIPFLLIVRFPCSVSTSTWRFSSSPETVEHAIECKSSLFDGVKYIRLASFTAQFEHVNFIPQYGSWQWNALALFNLSSSEYLCALKALISSFSSSLYALSDIISPLRHYAFTIMCL